MAGWQITVTFNNAELTSDRDEDLIKGLCSAARSTRTELRDWIEAELKSSLIEAQMQETLLEGELKNRVQMTVNRLRVINVREFPEAVAGCDGTNDEISNGGYTDVYDAYDQLFKEHAKLVNIVRELLEIRSFVGEM